MIISLVKKFFNIIYKESLSSTSYLKKIGIGLSIVFFEVGVISILQGSIGAVSIWSIGIISVVYTMVMMEERLISKYITLEVVNRSDCKKLEIPQFAYYIVISALMFIMIISEISFLFLSILALITYILTRTKVFREISSFNEVSKKSVCYIEKYSPSYCIYLSGPAGTEYQVNQWLPVIEKISEKSIIIIREHHLAKGIKVTRVPIVFAKNALDLERVLVKSIKTILYPGNPMKNAQALRHYELNHYFINHGESDKSVNQSKFLQAYDKLLLSGVLSYERLLNAGLSISAKQVEYVGRPQAEMLLSPKEQKNVSFKSGRVKVLYAPTWEGFVDGANYSSVSSQGLSIVVSLSNNPNVDLVFKPHPYTGRRSQETKKYLEKITDICRESDVAYRSSECDLYTLMNESDVLISDVSSVMVDYLYTDKPIIMCDTSGLSLDELEIEFPISKAAYIHGSNEDVSELIEGIIFQDFKNDERLKVKKKVLGENSNSFEVFQRIVLESTNVEA